MRQYLTSVFQLVSSLPTLVILAQVQGAAFSETNRFGPAHFTVDEQQNLLLIGCARSPAILVCDPITVSIRSRLHAAGLVTGVAAATENYYATSFDGTSSFIESFDKNTLQRNGRVFARLGARSPVLAGSPARLYVCNQFDNSVTAHELSSLMELERFPMSREPVYATLSPDGKTLAIANHLPTGLYLEPEDAATVVLLDLVDMTNRSMRLPFGSTAVEKAAFSPDGAWCAVTHNIARFKVPTVQVEHGWMNVAGLTLFRIDGTEQFSVLLDDPRLGAANPDALAWTQDGKTLLVTHAGTHELSVINWPKLLLSLRQRAESDRDRLNYIGENRKRLRLPGMGPRAMVIVGGFAYVAEYFSDTVSRVDVITGALEDPVRLSAAPETMEQTGERLFHDALLGHQQWQSCATCHPAGRTDGLNWDLLNDGIGNPKNTKSLLLSHATPPVMALSARESAETAVRSGLRHIMFAIRPESEAVAIDACLRSLKPLPSPFLVEGKHSQSAERGRKVFDRAGCASCHPAPLFTDLKSYDVGTRGPADKPKDKFDTPTLVETWRTAPYLHDDSAKTIREVVTNRNQDDTHGVTSMLSEEEIDDLCAYLLSL